MKVLKVKSKIEENLGLSFWVDNGRKEILTRSAGFA